jgi:hypothetical protein
MTFLGYKRLSTAALAVLGLVVASGSPGQRSPTSDVNGKTFPVEELRQDLKVLWDVLDEGHGGFERYTPRETLKKIFDDASSRLTKPLTEMEFYRLLLPLIAAIQDGHTSLRMSGPGRADLLSRPVFFPLELRFIDGKSYVFRNLSGTPEIGIGSELLTINGTPIAQVLARLLPLVPRDAGVQTRPLRLLENPNRFGECFAAEFGPAESYRIGLRKPAGGGEMSLSAAGIKGADINRLLQERYPEAVRRRPLYDLTYQGATAVITIRGFGDDSGPGVASYPEFIQKTFRELEEKKVGTLIIDLRGNGGGADEYGRLLFAHFMAEPFLYYKALERKKEKYDLVKYIGGGGESTATGALRKNARGWYDVLDHPNVGIMKPETPRFTGRTGILVDGLSFSTTGESTSLFHYHKKAVFIGEECGAGYYGNTSGGMVMVSLPGTRLQLIVPLTLYTLAVEGYSKDRGIVPDYPVTPTIEDLLAGRDVVIEKALNVLAKK